jgi:hypothetical protein
LSPRARQVDTKSPLYLSFMAYATWMVIIWPFGVPLLYTSMVWRHRHELRELRTIELAMGTDLARAKIEANCQDSALEASQIMTAADAKYEQTNEVYEELRERLPTALQRLTAGYELRTYWCVS